jgi:1,4-alpha-glucan branching enzyme
VKKEQVKNSNKWSVTFVVAPEVDAQSVAVLGDFNEWSADAGVMQQRKDGFWAKTIRFDPGTYRYRFLADGERWLNDPDADGYEPSGYGTDNSLLILG